MPDAFVPTSVIVFTPAAIHAAAWVALLDRQPGIALAGTAPLPATVATLTAPSRPTAILVDVTIPRPELARELVAAAPGVGLLFLLDALDLDGIVGLVRGGALGCLSREVDPPGLVRGLIAVGRGEIVLPPGMAARVLAALASGQQATAPPDALSEREAEVVALLARGMTNKDIAEELFLSVRTVEAHLRSVFAKLGVRSRTEAALWAVQSRDQVGHR